MNINKLSSQQKTVEKVKITARFPRLVQGRVAELN